MGDAVYWKLRADENASPLEVWQDGWAQSWVLSHPAATGGYRDMWKWCFHHLMIKCLQVKKKKKTKQPILFPSCLTGIKLMFGFQGPDAHQCYNWLVVIQIATQGAQVISPAASAASCLPVFGLISPPVALPWHHRLSSVFPWCFFFFSPRRRPSIDK